MGKKKDFMTWLMRSYRITFMIIGVLFVLGIIGFDKMAKAEFPDFTIRQGVVVAVYPGATAEEVEAQVARPLERYLFTYDEVRREKTTTTSQNGMCIAMVELQEDVNNKDEVWSKIRHGLNSFKSQSLPSGVLAIVVNDDFGSSSAMLIALESEHRTDRELKDYSDDLADRLRRIKSVSNVVLYGESKEQISIYVDQKRLSAYGISRTSVMGALQSAGMTTMSGSISGMRKDVPIHVEPRSTSEQDIENTIVYSDPRGKIVKVKDVATVKREYDNTTSYIEYNGHPCVLLSLEMIAGNNIVQYGKDVKQVLDEFQAKELPDDVHMSAIVDQSDVVGTSVSDFMINLLESMVIIVIVMLLLFPWRTALIAGITVPVSTFISIAIMYFVGIPLNTATLAGLILVLGMVVDNAIVILDGYLEYLGRGIDRWTAATESAKHYFMPMMLATLCISAIFFPFLLTFTGQMYDFVFWLPWTIFINLMVSLVLAMTMIPVLEYFLIRTAPVKKEGQKESITERMQRHYEKGLARVFAHPWISLSVAAAFTVGTFFLAPTLKIRMMPVADRNQFAVEITLPSGAGLADTEAIADSVMHALQREDDVESITSFIGCASPRFHAAYAPKIAGRNYAQFIVNTKSNAATVRLLDKYEPLYSDRFPGAFVKFKQLDFQAYTPFEMRFYGQDADSLRAVADELMAELRQDPELMNVHTDWEDMRPIINVELDDVASSQLGITRTMAELQLALSTGNTQVGQVWEGNYEVPIMLKDVHKDALDADGIDNIYMHTTMGQSVPLRQVAQASPVWVADNIVHRNGERCLTVTCETRRGVLSAPVHSRIAEIMESKVSLPEGVRYEVGGEPYENADMMGKIMVGFAIAIGIVFIFVLFNFRRYKMATACLVALVLILPGTILGLAAMGRDIGVTAIFGVIALMGSLMRNEILIFEHADTCMREQGMTAKEAAFDAGRRRMVPIFLTTATTAVGVVPMIIAATSFWMPVGTTIFVGGIVSLILVVFVLPLVYWQLNYKKPVMKPGETE